MVMNKKIACFAFFLMAFLSFGQNYEVLVVEEGTSLAGLVPLASQAEVDAGVVSNKLVSPLTLENFGKWNNYLSNTAPVLLGNLDANGNSITNAYSIEAGAFTLLNYPFPVNSSFVSIYGANPIWVDSSGGFHDIINLEDGDALPAADGGAVTNADASTLFGSGTIPTNYLPAAALESGEGYTFITGNATNGISDGESIIWDATTGEFVPGNNNTYLADVRLTTNQVAYHGTDVTFNYVIESPTDCFNSTSGTYTVKMPGKYLVNYSIVINAQTVSAGGYITVGTNVFWGSRALCNASYGTGVLGGSVIVRADKGDVMNVVVAATAGTGGPTAVTILGATALNLTRATIYRIGD